MPGEDRPMPEARPSASGSGASTVDPTRNVLDLVRAAIQRQDDLRDGLEKYWEARFESIQHEFELIESRRIEQKTDTKVAVDAALSAAEKAVKEQAAASEKSITKSETSAAEATRQQNATFTAQIGGVEQTVSDLKDRLGILETQQRTKNETRDNSRSNLGLIVSVIAASIGFVMMLLGVAAFIASRGAG